MIFGTSFGCGSKFLHCRPRPEWAAHNTEVAMGMAEGFGLTVVAGVMTGEWRQMEPRISRANLLGVAVLFLAVILIGAANYSVR